MAEDLTQTPGEMGEGSQEYAELTTRDGNAETPLVSKDPTGEQLGMREAVREQMARDQQERLDRLKAGESESGVAPR